MDTPHVYPLSDQAIHRDTLAAQLAASTINVLLLALIALGCIVLSTSDAAAEAISCESLGLDPRDGEGNRLLERYYVRRDGVGGLGCWVHRHPNGTDAVVTPYSWMRNPNPGKLGLITDTFDAITDSRHALAPLGRIHRRLYFLLNDVHDGAEAYWPADDECWMEAGSRGGEAWRSNRWAWKGVVAHEIGHCFLMSNITGYSPRTAATHDRWWDESGAEFYSTVVYPELNHEHIDVAAFFDLDGVEFTQPYKAYALLQHYASIGGNGSVMALLQRIFAQDSGSNLRSFFRRTAFDKVYHDFATLLYNNKLEDSGGGFIPRELHVDPLLDTRLSEPRGELEFGPVLHSRLNLVVLTFPAKKNLRLTPPPSTSSRYFYSLLNRGTLIGNWSFPTTIRGNCDYPHFVDLFATHMNEEKVKKTLNYELVDREECEAPEPAVSQLTCNAQADLDPCLVGAWRMTDESMAHVDSGGAPRKPDSPTPEDWRNYRDDPSRYIPLVDPQPKFGNEHRDTPAHRPYIDFIPSGSITLSIDATGKFVKHYDADFLVVKYSSHPLDPYNRVESTRHSSYSGAVAGCITSDRHTLGPSYLVLQQRPLDNVVVHITGTRIYERGFNIRKQGTPWNEWPRLQGRGKMTYSCADNTLFTGKRKFIR